MRPAELALWAGDLAGGLDKLGLFLPTVGTQLRQIPLGQFIFFGRALTLRPVGPVDGGHTAYWRVWRGLYYLGPLIFPVALFLSFSGWLRRRME